MHSSWSVSCGCSRGSPFACRCGWIPRYTLERRIMRISVLFKSSSPFLKVTGFSQSLHSSSHSDVLDIRSNLNSPPSVPIPSFFMDKFMLFSPSLGFMEHSLSSYVDALLAKAQSATVNSCHEPLLPLPLFDITPPPSYPYTKTPSSYSAVIQLYARSGQLDTAFHLSSHLKDG